MELLLTKYRHLYSSEDSDYLAKKSIVEATRKNEVEEAQRDKESALKEP